MFIYNSRIVQFLLCAIYPFLYLGAYILAGQHKNGYLTAIIFIALWLIYAFLLKKIYYALISNGLAIFIALPLVNHLLVVHDKTNNYDFFPVIDVVFIIIAFSLQAGVIYVRNTITYKHPDKINRDKSN